MQTYAPSAKKAIRDLLAADTILCAELATYEFSSGSAEEAAIFTGRDMPEDAALPAVMIAERSAENWGCRGNPGGVLHIDVQIVAEKDQSDKTLENMAWRIRDLLNRSTPTMTGYTCEGCVADPPLQTTADSSYPSYTIRAKCWVLKT